MPASHGFAAHVAASSLKQCGEMFLSANSVREMTAFKYLANADFLTSNLLA